MNDPGSLRARRACCEVLFKAIAPLSLVYIFTTHKPAHITMRILLCGTSEMRSSDLLTYKLYKEHTEQRLPSLSCKAKA